MHLCQSDARLWFGRDTWTPAKRRTTVLIHGLDVDDIPEGWQAIRCLVIVECVDFSDPDVTLSESKRVVIRTTDDLDSWTAIGLLRVAEADFLRDVLDDLTEG